MPPVTALPGLWLAQAGGIAPAAAILGLAAAGVLGWLYWRTRREYQIELAEHVEEVATEQERNRQTAAERDALFKDSQAKSEMLATLSREIRAHLTGVVGSADLLLENS